MSNVNFLNKDYSGIPVYAEMLFRNGTFAKAFPDNYLDAYKRYVYEFGVNPRTHSEHHIFRFDNGYGASVVRGPYTYGGDEGLFELAVIHFIEPKHADEGEEYAYNLDYDTDITQDVLGYLSEEEVVKYLTEIKALPEYVADNENDEED